MPSPSARRATCRPIRPKPSTPRRLVGQLDPAPARALPAPLLQRRVRLRDVARERDEQADRVLRGRDDGRLGSVRDHDPRRVAAFDVDVVDPDAGAADHLQTLGPLDQLRGQLRRRADHDRVVVGDRPPRAASPRRRRRRSGSAGARPRLRDLLPDEDPQTWGSLRRRPRAPARRATPRSIGAPSSPSTSSTAASAVAMSNSSYQPMWPIRKIASFSSPWPAAIVTPWRSRSASVSSRDRSPRACGRR